MRLLPTSILTALVLLSAPVAARDQKAPALADVLKAAGDYLIAYSDALGVISADEEFSQQDLSIGQGALAPPARRLTSDFVFVGLGRGLIATYRDVYLKDGRSLRDHRNRLLETFQKSPVRDAMQEGQRLSDAATQQYITANMRMFDDPMLPMQFLRKENQDHSTFTLDSVKTMGGAQVAILKFNETAMPRLLGAPEDAPGTGRFWVNVSDGAIRQMELSVGTRSYHFRVSVTLTEDRALKLWLPAESYQQLEITAANMGNNNGVNVQAVRQSLEGRVRYSKFQQGKLGG